MRFKNKNARIGANHSNPGKILDNPDQDENSVFWY